MKKVNLPCVVTLAGTDPSGGAGIQADIKTISATGCYAASVITVLVSQNTQGVRSIYSISPEFVMNQIQAVFEDLSVDAVKIGMLYNRDIIDVVSLAIQKYVFKNVVLDPVMYAKDKHALFSLSDLDFLKEKIFPYVDLITPNLDEAEIILNKKIQSLSDMEFAAKDLAQEYQINVLIKGGHLKNDASSDVLYSIRNQSSKWFHGPRIQTKNTHGTGCALSSALASYLAQGYSLIDAVQKAKFHVTQSIQIASGIQIGKGNGPVSLSS